MCRNTARGGSRVANRTPKTVTVCLPKTLIKGYRITAVTKSGQAITVADTDRNILGCVNHSMPDEELVSVSFVPVSTWGDADTEAVRLLL